MARSFNPRLPVIRAGFDLALANVEAQERRSGGLGNLSSSLVAHCKIAAMAKSHSGSTPHKSDIVGWQMHFVATAVRAGQL